MNRKVVIVDLYPSIEEILAKDELKCLDCSKEFMNVSALKLHRVKKHGVIKTAADRRIYEKIQDYMSTSYIYHCPSEPCMEKNVKFVGLNNLRQHYYRVHGEKNVACDLCEKTFALKKDLDYHRKARCHNRPAGDPEKNVIEPKKPPKKAVKRKANDLQPSFQSVSNYMQPNLGFLDDTNCQPSTSTQPIILIVPTENVTATIEQLSRSFRTTSEAGVQVQTISNDTMYIPHTTNIAVGAEQPESYDFSGQFDSMPNTSDVGDYFYNSNQNTDVRHISTGTDFSLPPFMDFAMDPSSCMGESHSSSLQNYHQASYSHGDIYPPQQQQQPCKTTNYTMAYCEDHNQEPSTRSMGTAVDESLFDADCNGSLNDGLYRHVATEIEEDAISMLGRDKTNAISNTHIHTQTFWD